MLHVLTTATSIVAVSFLYIMAVLDHVLYTIIVRFKSLSLLK